MKILLLGATGMIGSRIAAEAARRNHDLTAASRSGDAPEIDAPEMTTVSVDASDANAVAEAAAGHDAVVSSISPLRDGTDPREPYLTLFDALVEGIRKSGVRRLIVVGGAGSLEVAPGVALVDTPDFPEAYKAEALVHHDVLEICRDIDDLEWSYISPAVVIAPGERTGSFRIGGDQLLSDSEGNSRISAEDFAIAVVDELEKGEHLHSRMSVAY